MQAQKQSEQTFEAKVRTLMTFSCVFAALCAALLLRLHVALFQATSGGLPAHSAKLCNGHLNTSKSCEGSVPDTSHGLHMLPGPE